MITREMKKDSSFMMTVTSKDGDVSSCYANEWMSVESYTKAMFYDAGQGKFVAAAVSIVKL